MQSPVFSKHDLSGVVIDIPPERIEERLSIDSIDKSIVHKSHWSTALNVHFRDKAAERAGGYGLFAHPPSGPPLFILSVILPTVAYWIYTTTTKIYVTDGTNHFDITPAAGISTTTPDNWTGGLLNGLPFLNNQKDVPWYWDGQTGNVMVPLPGWPANTLCKAMRAFKYHLFAMGITQNSIDYPELCLHSDGADPGAVPASWDPLPSNEAGSFSLSSTPGSCVDAEKLRDQFVIYKDFASYIVQYVGGAFVFKINKLFLTSGIQANNCVAEMHGKHYVFTGDDIIVHDANQFKSIATWKIKRGINNVDRSG